MHTHTRTHPALPCPLLLLPGAAGGEAHPSRTAHGLTLLVRGYESAFSRISLDRLSFSLPPAAPSKAAPATDLEAGGVVQGAMAPATAAGAALPAAAEAASWGGREEAAAQRAAMVVEAEAQADVAQQRAQLEREFLAAEAAAEVAAEAHMPQALAADRSRTTGF